MQRRPADSPGGDEPRPVNHRGWWFRAASWVAVCGLAAILLALSLHRRANPWQLQLLIHSGIPESCYGYDSPGGPADISPDGHLLAVGRPSGQCEVWNLDSMQRISVVGEKLPPMPDVPPGSAGVYGVRWLADGRHIALNRHHAWNIFELDGTRVRLTADTRDYERGAAESPMGALLACARAEQAQVIDAGTGAVKYHWDLHWVNNSNRRFDWTPDGRYLLLNDLAGVRVWDMRDGRLAYFHRELDLSLPPPMIANEHSGIEAYESEERNSLPQSQSSPNRPSTANLWAADDGRSNFAELTDSRFAPGGAYFATLYGGDDRVSTPGNTQVNRLRFYDTATGSLLWDTVLPGRAWGMAFSPDGSRLFVLIRAEYRKPSFIEVEDTARHRAIAKIDLDGIRSNPSEINSLPDGRWLAASGSDLWLVDTSGRCAPLHILPASPNTAEVLARPAGQQLIDVGRDTWVRVYHMRREPSALGAFALPETWGIYAAVILMVLGVVLIAGRDSSRRRPMPRALRAAVTLASLGIGCNLADQIVGLAAGAVYEPPAGVSIGLVFHWGMLLLWIAATIGVVRLRRGWWVTQLFLLGIAAPAVLLATGPDAQALDAGASRQLSLVSFHGVPIDGTTCVTLTLTCGLAWLVAQAWLLLQPQVRSCIPRPAEKARVHPEGLRGFPLD